MTDQTKFKRLNFFTGFLTEADDWKQEQEYHIEKYKLHNRYLHTPGIIHGEGKDLKVVPGTGTGLCVKVLPGAAIDGDGNVLYLEKEHELLVAPPGTNGEMYVFIKYRTSETDLQENPEDPDYSGCTRISEEPEVGCYSGPAPDNKERIELARIKLQPGANTISDNEIDRSQVVWAGAVDKAIKEPFKAVEERFKRLYDYEEQELGLHGQGLHTPGLLYGVAQAFQVQAAGGMDLRVLPGAALDGQGHQICLKGERIRTVEPPGTESVVVYVKIRYQDPLADYFADLSAGQEKIGEGLVLQVNPIPPDNETWLELARVHLQPGVKAILNPHDTKPPGANEIDRRYVTWAGGKDLDEQRLLDRINRLHEYHLEKQRRHNRGLYRPGLLHEVREELDVRPGYGLSVEVWPGAALTALEMRCTWINGSRCRWPRSML